MKNQKTWHIILTLLLGAAAFAPMVYTENLLFPFITTKAFFFRFFTILAVPVILYLSLVASKKVSLKNPIVYLIAGYLVVAVISGLFGAYPTKSWWSNYERMTGVFYLFTLFIYLYGLILIGKLAPKLFKKLLYWHLIVALIATLYGFYVGLGGTGFFPDPSGARLSSMFGNPIFFASYLIVPTTFSLFFFLESETRKQKLIFIGLAVLFMIATLYTGTRGALVGWIIGAVTGLFYVSLTSHVKKIKQYALYGLIAGVVGIVALFLIGRAMPQGSSLKRVTNLFDSNSSSRLIQWQTALQGFKDNPILGIGPENYNVIANYYYIPKQYLFDRSWFDKPHNYWLEVLTTTGILGFALYLSLYVYSLIIVRRAVKYDLITSIQGGVLFAGIVAYQVQNLFVFDTISASMSIFCLLAFIGYLFEMSHTSQGFQLKAKHFPIAKVGFGIASLIAVYGVYATVIMPYKAAVAVNYGYAYSQADAYKADEYFNTAINAPFQFDMVEVASKYAEFATGLVNSPVASQNKQFINATLDRSISLLQNQLEKSPRNAILQYQLAIAISTKQSFNGQAVDDTAMQAIEKARSLSPNRPEILSFQAQIYAFQGNIEEAISLLEQGALISFPTNPDLRWRLAEAYADQKRYASAVEASNAAFELGYIPKSPNDLDWLISYYVTQKNGQKVIDLFTILIQNYPRNATLRARLAQAYLETGQYNLARSTALSVIDIDPSTKAEVDAFIAKIPQN
jgi:O-antigen ligase/cytochrome c-type biogenesis protein CcmH/NrfG